MAPNSKVSWYLWPVCDICISEPVTSEKWTTYSQNLIAHMLQISKSGINERMNFYIPSNLFLNAKVT